MAISSLRLLSTSSPTATRVDYLYWKSGAKMVKNAEIVGEALAEVLPQYEKPWFRVPHLLRLNLILLVPLLSSSVAGYDGSMMNGLQSTSSWRTYFGNPRGQVLGVVNVSRIHDSCGCGKESLTPAYRLLSPLAPLSPFLSSASSQTSSVAAGHCSLVLSRSSLPLSSRPHLSIMLCSSYLDFWLALAACLLHSRPRCSSRS